MGAVEVKRPLVYLLKLFVLSSFAGLYSCAAPDAPQGPADNARSIQPTVNAVRPLQTRAIDARWSGISDEFTGGIDAALNWEDGHASWFSGDWHTCFTMDGRGMSHKARSQPMHARAKCAAGWPAADSAKGRGLDAAVLLTDGTGLVFRGSAFIAVEQTGRVESQMREIGGTDPENGRPWWPGLPDTFHAGVDAAAQDGLGSIFFFKGPHFVRYDQYLDEVIEGPTAIAARWPELPEDFAQGVDAAMRVGRGKIAFFRDGKTLEAETSVAL